ncbi:MAG: hypothetical protein DSM106950_02600 [Stigonema ocellatum SAG 48.90 = DSM 106950]|nr:hypothetical protein [Stigonema ocellatum SAG 48.90 = DSM 106950]
MLMTESLTETQWQIAHAIALTLVKEETDVNELGKAIAYLRTSVNQPDGGAKFFKYLKTLVSNGQQIGHSGKTTNYYRSIERACNQYLQREQTHAQTMLQILGWAARLMRYYKDASPIEQITLPLVSTGGEQPQVRKDSARQPVAQVTSSHDFVVGQILEATVTAIKGNKVTYEILGTTIKLSEKEPKKAKFLSEGQKVKVEILDLKEDGSIRKLRGTD